MDNQFFAEWLAIKLKKKNWSQSELARISGVTRQAISNYMAGKINKPDEDSLKAIARAFGIPAETIFRAAGILSNQPGMDEDFEELKHIFNQMTDEEQEEFLATGRLKIELRNKRGELREKQQTRPANV